MALINGTKAHPMAATAGIVGGIVAMPFAVAGTAVVGALGTVAVTIPSLGLLAPAGALVTAGCTVGEVFTSPFKCGRKIYNKLVPSEDSISFGTPILDGITLQDVMSVASASGPAEAFDNFKEVLDI